MGKFLLSNIRFAPFSKPGVEDDYEAPDKIIEKHFDYGKGAKYWSYALMRAGTNQNTYINPTGVPGYIMNIYYSMMFEFPKDQWRMVKRSESIDVTPVHHQYYQITHGQKDALEAKIREGMVKISQSIADLELVMHDLIKYEDFEKKFLVLDKKYEKDASKEEKEDLDKKQSAATMELKTTFVDEVDFHAGGGTQGAGRLSMAFMRNNNIMPTIVDDFFRMNSREDLEKNPSLKNIPTVEKRMLEVKFQAYEDWMGYFKANVTRRMAALRNLQKSREKTLSEYREWLKPSIARYKMIVDSLENAEGRTSAMTQRIRTSGVATSFNSIVLWMWKSFVPPEPHRPPQELIEKNNVRAVGDWEYKHFYFHYDHGLVVEYPWITKAWIKAKIGLDDDGYIKHLPADERIGESSWYYSFMEIRLGRTNIKTSATGAELEDGDFYVTNYMMSKNVLAAKYLELKAYEENDMEIYIDDMLGLQHKIPGKPIVFYKKEKGKYVIDAERYRALQKFIFMDGEKAIVLPPEPGEMKSKKDLEKHFLKDKKRKKKEFSVELIEYDSEEKIKRDKFIGNVKENLGIRNLRLFLPSGPYERNWNERIKKMFLKPNTGRFEYVTNFIKSKMNVGGGP